MQPFHPHSVRAHRTAPHRYSAVVWAVYNTLAFIICLVAIASLSISWGRAF